MFNKLFASKIKYKQNERNESLILLNGGVDGLIKNNNTGEVYYSLFPIGMMGRKVQSFTLEDLDNNSTYIMR